MTEARKILESLHPLERKVWPHLKQETTSVELEKTSGLKDIELLRALQWLDNKGLLKLRTIVKEVVSLGEDGKEYLKKGLPERRFLENLKGITLASKIPISKQELSVCIGLLKQKNAIKFHTGKELAFEITEEGKKLLQGKWVAESFLKRLPLEVDSLAKEDRELYFQLKTRGQIITTETKKELHVTLTELGTALQKVKLSQKEVIDVLTPKMLAEGYWKDKDFRRYDVKAQLPPLYQGRRHFVMQALKYIKKIWLELGFTEMTGNMVQTAFWDLDALFVPQDHPARTMQDTFYLKNPKYGKLPELRNKVKQVHENGADTGSTGWQEPWNEKIAQELLLRTHTTVLSAQTLAKLKESQLPAKFFAVGKVYRNEALDWKHLFEFEQVEGIVIDPNANFKHLKGYLKEFYQKMGFEKVRMRPSHFPYTEPSVEVDVYNPVKKQWVELGGAGIFRPEVTKTLLGKEIPVLAWGQGMGRIISEYYSIKDIRNLNSNDLKQIRNMREWLQGCLR